MKIVHLRIKKSTPEKNSTFVQLKKLLNDNHQQIIHSQSSGEYYEFLITSVLYQMIERSVDILGQHVLCRVYYVDTFEIENEIARRLYDRDIEPDEATHHLLDQVRGIPRSKYQIIGSEKFVTPGKNIFSEKWQKFKNDVYFVDYVKSKKDG